MAGSRSAFLKNLMTNSLKFMRTGDLLALNGHFPLGGTFRAERHFHLETIFHGKFRPVENDH